MALNWTNLNPTAEWLDLDPHTQEALIFRTMHLGIPKITADTVQEFYDRAVELDRAHGSDPYLSLEDVQAAVGLSTNASRITPTKFKKLIRDRMARA